MRYGMVGVLAAVLFVACAPTNPPYHRVQVDYSKASAENKSFAASIQVYNPDGCSPRGQQQGSCEYTGYILTIQNKTTKDIELDWDRTFYLEDGQANGGFMYAGVLYMQRNNPKPPDIIFPGTWRKVILPNMLVRRGEYAWYNEKLGQGISGASVAVNVNGVLVRENLLVKVDKELVRTTDSIKTQSPPREPTRDPSSSF
jgi:hypothetical protein